MLLTEMRSPRRNFELRQDKPPKTITPSFLSCHDFPQSYLIPHHLDTCRTLQELPRHPRLDGTLFVDVDATGAKIDTHSRYTWTSVALAESVRANILEPQVHTETLSIIMANLLLLS